MQTKQIKRPLYAWTRWVGLGVVGMVACTVTETRPSAPEHSGSTVSSSIVVTIDNSTVWVVNQDADSVSVIDTQTRSLLAEIPLGVKAPAEAPVTRRFDPAVLPRSLAIVNSKKVYVAGQASGQVYVIDAVTREVMRSIPVPAAPTGIAAAPDGSAVYVVSHEAAQVSRIDPVSDTLVASHEVTEHPWGVTVSNDGQSLFVTHLLRDPGVSVMDTQDLRVRGKVPLAEQAPGKDKRLANGVARGVYTAVPNPVTGELWMPHILLAVNTAQPDLDFESTVFPTVSTIVADGSEEGRRLLFRPQALPNAEGAFSEVVSGPRAAAFTPSGKLALVANAQSEDVIVFDVASGTQAGLVRPLPSALLEGIAMDHAGKHAYVDGRNTHDVTVLAINEADPIAPVVVDGPSIQRLGVDPMPEVLRQGQRLFYTANSAAFPVTTNFWVACVSCHIEGGSDAVTWLFHVGPRDTPSNAGGPGNTGFLLRQAQLSNVEQYDVINREEQGGSYHLDNPKHQSDLKALARYVNDAIPFPPNPYRSPNGTLTTAAARGETTFQKLCASCHTGPYLTDSGAENPGLNLSQTVKLWNVGTCVEKGNAPDHETTDRMGNPRKACDFDTPTLRGIFATPPYLHDGSAPTLRDVLDRFSFSSGLSDADKDDLVAYMRTL